MALLAKAHQKPFYALAESYKFLRHYPLSQTDLPNPKAATLHGHAVVPLSFDTSAFTRARPASGPPTDDRTMIDLNPKVDVTVPSLVDYIITDLGSPLSPTSVSQYIVAQFAN
jgi:translation initiation factor eIF-2B subunit alpha